MSYEADVLFRAVADFTSVSRAVRQLRQDIAALRAEEAAFNASQTSGATRNTSSSRPTTTSSPSTSTGASTLTAEATTQQQKLAATLAIVSTAYQQLARHTQEYSNQNSKVVTSLAVGSVAYQQLARHTQEYSQQNAAVTASNTQVTRSLKELESESTNVRTIQGKVISSYTEIVRSSKELDTAQKAISSSGREVVRSFDGGSKDVELYRKHLDDVVVAHHSLQNSSKSVVSSVDGIGNSLSRGSGDVVRYLGVLSKGGADVAKFGEDIAGAGEAGGSGGGGGVLKFLSDTADGFGDIGKSALKMGAIIVAVVALLGSIGPLIAIVGALATAAGAAAAGFAQLLGVAALLPGVLAVAGLSVAALAVSLSGVKEAIEAGFAVAKNSKQIGEEATKQQISQNEQITASVRALRDAYEAQARGAVVDTRSVRDAEEELNKTIRQNVFDKIDAQKSIINDTDTLTNLIARQGQVRVKAQEGVVDANDNLAQSEVDLHKSQLKVNDARAEALQQLKDLKQAVQDAAVAQEGAAAQLGEAQQSYAKVLADPGATQIDKQSALAGVHASQQGVVDAQNNSIKTQTDYNKAQQKGVEGSDQVVDAKKSEYDAEKALQRAKEGVTDAILAQSDAIQKNIKDISDAQEAVAKDYVRQAEVQSNATNGIRSAQEKLSDAQRQQTLDSRNNAEAVGLAQQKLADTYRDVAYQQEHGIGEIDAYNKALTHLSPTARDVVEKIVGMHGAFTDLKTSVQEDFFSKFDGSIDGISKVLPDVQSNLGKVAGSLGGVADAFIRWITAPGQKEFFDNLATKTSEFIDKAGPVLLDTFGSLETIITASLPYIGRLLDDITDVAKKFNDFIKTPEGKKFLDDLFTAGVNTAEELATNIGHILHAFYEMYTLGKPFIDKTLGAIDDLAKGFDDYYKKTDKKTGKNNFQTYLENLGPLLHELNLDLKAFFGFFSSEATDPKNITLAIELLKQFRTEVGPEIRKLLDDLRDSGIAKRFVDFLGDFIHLLDVIVGHAVGFHAFLIFLDKFVDLLTHLAEILSKIGVGPFNALNLIIGVLGSFVGFMVVLAGLKFLQVFKLFEAIASFRAGAGIVAVIRGLAGVGAAAGAGGVAGAGAAGEGAAVGIGAGAAALGARGVVGAGAAGEGAGAGEGALGAGEGALGVGAAEGAAGAAEVGAIAGAAAAAQAGSVLGGFLGKYAGFFSGLAGKIFLGLAIYQQIKSLLDGGIGKEPAETDLAHFTTDERTAFNKAGGNVSAKGTVTLAGLHMKAEAFNSLTEHIQEVFLSEGGIIDPSPGSAVPPAALQRSTKNAAKYPELPDYARSSDEAGAITPNAAQDYITGRISTIPDGATPEQIIDLNRRRDAEIEKSHKAAIDAGVEDPYAKPFDASSYVGQSPDVPGTPGAPASVPGTPDVLIAPGADSAISPDLTKYTGALTTAFDALGQMLNAIIKAFDALGQTLNGVLPGLQGLAGNGPPRGAPGYQTIPATDGGTLYLNGYPGQDDSYQGYARGGIVPGSGNSDTTLIRTTPGEGIIPVSRMKQLGPDGFASVMGFANGGIVPNAGYSMSSWKPSSSMGMVTSMSGLRGGHSSAAPTGASHNYEITVNNPTPEPASDSIPNALRKATYLNGRK